MRYGGRVVVDDVDLSAKPGEVLSIAGPNGAGKSTLLAVLSRSVVPCAGTVQIDRTDINLLHPVALARRRAVLEQTPIRDLPFSVVELVEMSIPSSVQPDRTTQISADLLDLLGLRHLSDQPVNTLSGGEAHRAHLARAMAQLRAARDLGEGNYFLIDEPTASLDLAHQREVLNAARGLAKEGIGVIVILHDLTLTAAISDRTVLMCDGRIAAEGRPDDVLTPEILEGVYRTPLRTVRVENQLAVLPRL